MDCSSSEVSARRTGRLSREASRPGLASLKELLVGKNRLAVAISSAPRKSMQDDKRFILRCGSYYVGLNGTSRVSCAEHAKRYSQVDAQSTLQRLTSATSLYPLPWEVIELGGTR